MKFGAQIDVFVLSLLLTAIAYLLARWIWGRVCRAMNLRIAGGARISWQPWTLSLKLTDVIQYMVWFEIVNNHGGDNPDSYADSQLMDITHGKYRKTRRFPLEEFSDKRRLIITALESVTISICVWSEAASSPVVSVVVNNLRLHLPSQNETIAAEQRILYPDGYPNYVQPIYDRFIQPMQWLLKHAVPFAMRHTSVVVTDIEVHGFADAGAQLTISETMRPGMQEISWLSSVKALGNVIRNTRKFIQNSATPVGGTLFLTAFIASAELKMLEQLPDSQCWKVCSSVRDVIVVRGDAACSLEMAIRLYPIIAKISGLKSDITLFPMVRIPHTANLKACLSADNLLYNNNNDYEERDGNTRKDGVNVWLAKETTTKYAAPCKVLTRIPIPYSISSEFISSVVYNFKHLLFSAISPVAKIPVAEDNSIGTLHPAPSQWNVPSLVKPWVDLWWDDVGVGDLVSNVTGNVVEGMIKSANDWDRPVEAQTDITLRW